MNTNPFQILTPQERWRPQITDKQTATAPLVQRIREAVAEWRNAGYPHTSETSLALLRFWFDTPHPNNFRFYFSQREAIESIIYLYEVAEARDKYDLIAQFDSSGELTPDAFEENWTRYVVKMATGAGKTKVAALVIVWAYFHKLYEPDSTLSKNFLFIAPNIIVFNRLLKDFEGLRMFFDEPFLPDDDYCSRYWRSDFQPTLHLQDDVHGISESGNIFLTNIHRVYVSDPARLSVEETFLGIKPKPDADTVSGIDLGKLLRSGQIKDLVVVNDEAHHIHDEDLQWYKCISDIHNRLKLRYGNGLSLQADFTATPKHTNGAIFVQTICDYPLVEAIRQRVVKSPTLPDEASRLKLEPQDSVEFVERYRSFIELGVVEWKKQYDALNGVKKPVLFIMTTNTREADAVADFLQREYTFLNNAVLTIHTNKNGDVVDSGKRDKEELMMLRTAADEIDRDTSRYKVIVSVLMLREGWDVRNVTTIVGLRPFKAKSNILPEQTIGRGLRKMFDLNTPEELVVIGTREFLEFVETLKDEGVEFEYAPMGADTQVKGNISVSVDKDKDTDALDIQIPQMRPKIIREQKNLAELDVADLESEQAPFRHYSDDKIKEIVYRDIDGEITHTTVFSHSHTPDYRNVLTAITHSILREARLLNGHHILYPKVESFIKYRLWGREVVLSDPQTLRNLSEATAIRIVYETFRKAISRLTIVERPDMTNRGYASVAKSRPIVVKHQPYIAAPKKSLFDKVIGDSEYELQFAAAMEKWGDVAAYAKNTETGVGFCIEYQNEAGQIAAYYTDFLVRCSNGRCYAVELKGVEDEDVRLKRERLRQWCVDVNRVQEQQWSSLYILQKEWDKYRDKLRTFADVVELFEVK